MHGLNLETFLRLLRADLGAWLSLAAVGVILALMAWSSWGRRRALRKCLVLSIAVHVALVVFGQDQAAHWLGIDGDGTGVAAEEPPRSIQLVRDDSASNGPAGEASGIEGEDGLARRSTLADWDRPGRLIALNDAPMPAERPEPPPASAIERPQLDVPAPLPDAPAPDFAPPEASPAAPRPEPTLAPEPLALEAPPAAPTDLTELAPVTLAEPAPRPDAALAMPEPPASLRTGTASGSTPTSTPRRSESNPPPLAGNPAPTAPADPALDPPTAAPARSLAGNDPAPAPAADGPASADADGPAAVSAAPPVAPAVAMAMPDLDPAPRLGSPAARPEPSPSTPRRPDFEPVPLARAAAPAAPRLPDAATPALDRRRPEIPEVYRSRLAPNRTERAIAAGATPASEQAVERALAWLARHQSADGRWDAGTKKLPDGRTIAPGETSFVSLCPAGDRCEGECTYWEADTASTGLALLAYLGAGHTHQRGQYARNVALGLNFLLRTQRPDGDLRGTSKGVGMYCHAIATLAMCESYALSQDERLRRPVERAVDFLVKSRAADGQSWRYAPNDPFGGDTSILGWAILVLKSAREVGLPVPPDVRDGALKWLNRVAEGDHRGLALYRPGEGYPVTPTMTAEAWACRQFLGVGGAGLASDEAASYLLLHSPDRDPFNLYYWYYATLALYQHGGEPWARWNPRVRDQLVRRQVRGGHADGSWDPADCRDPYDKLGGRIYTTALAALSLEVYYRYLRLYDAPATPAPSMDTAVRRSGLDLGPYEPGSTRRLPAEADGPRP